MSESVLYLLGGAALAVMIVYSWRQTQMSRECVGLTLLVFDFSFLSNSAVNFIRAHSSSGSPAWATDLMTTQACGSYNLIPMLMAHLICPLFTWIQFFALHTLSVSMERICCPKPFLSHNLLIFSVHIMLTNTSITTVLRLHFKICLLCLSILGILTTHLNLLHSLP